jgi:hypothetical protein
MYASVRTYRCRPEDVPELLRRVDTEFAPMVKEEPGFLAYQVIDCGDGDVLSITEFDNREGVHRSVHMAAQWVAERLSDLVVVRTSARAGEVNISAAGSGVLEPAHV